MKTDFVKIVSLVSNIIFIIFILFLLNRLGGFDNIKKEIPGFSDSKIKNIEDSFLKSNIGNLIKKSGLDCESCKTLFYVGEGYDNKLGKVNVLWVDCGNNDKYTLHEEINSSKNTSELMSLIYYGWVE